MPNSPHVDPWPSVSLPHDLEGNLVGLPTCSVDQRSLRHGACPIDETGSENSYANLEASLRKGWRRPLLPMSKHCVCDPNSFEIF